MHTIADQIVASGQVLLNDDLLLHILNGFPSNNDPFVVHITSGDLISLPKAKSLLHSREMCIDHHQASDSIDLSSFARFAKKNSSRYSNCNGARGCRGRGSFHLVCQVCGKIGHLASKFSTSFWILLILPLYLLLLYLLFLVS